MTDNAKLYSDFIVPKFKLSQDTYKLALKDEPDVFFLAHYENHSIYSIYPRPLIIDLKTKNDTFHKNNPNNSMSINLDDQLEDQMRNKIKEFVSYEQKTKMYRGKEKVRRYFDYEIRDAVSKLVSDSYVTNAWCKMYEILSIYKFFGPEQKIINTFHICEHPGAFIYALKHYVQKNHPNSKHEFIFQSLKPESNPKIFKTEKKLLETHRDQLDYGADRKGDITNVDNILFYRKKYMNQHYDLITSDCGLDCSDDFNQQETILNPIYFGAFLAAIGLASKGTNYVCKMFSFIENKTIELIYLYCLFFHHVQIVRILTNKSGSAEIYVICQDFMFDKKDPKFVEMFENLIEYYRGYNKSKHLWTGFDTIFVKRIQQSSQLLSMTRIMNLNQLIFRIINYDYAHKHSSVMDYVKMVVNYYTHYYLVYTGLVTPARETLNV